MKELSRLLLLIIGMTAAAAMAQKADSVIVIYDNQKTIIPLPAFGSQTSVSYADSNKVIEIGVWLKKSGDISLFPQHHSNNIAIGKPKKKSKWFSQVEVGYIKKSTYGDGMYSSTYFPNGIPNTYSESYSVGDRKGYQARLSIQEKEFYLNMKFSFISCFKFGYAQSYLQAHSFFTLSDSSGNKLSSYDEDYKFRISSFQFLYQLGISYYFNTGKLPVRINLGNSMGIFRNNTKTNNQQTYGNFLFASRALLYTSLLQPYLGMEIWKMGILLSADFAVPYSPNNILHSDVSGNISIALTYRFF